MAYVWVGELQALLVDWDVERFRRDELAAYLERCTRWLPRRGS